MSRRPMRPEWFHGIVALAASLLLAAVALWLTRADWTGYRLLAAWLPGVNLTAFAYYGYDKWQARRGGRRVPEVVLHGVALAGGSLGAWLAMRVFRHKTIKGGFRFVFWTIVVLQAVLIVCIAYDLLWQAR
jgi:uncharacterized membrane protein YsdA (DUF1294 family)